MKYYKDKKKKKKKKHTFFSLSPRKIFILNIKLYIYIIFKFVFLREMLISKCKFISRGNEQIRCNLILIENLFDTNLKKDLIIQLIFY